MATEISNGLRTWKNPPIPTTLANDHESQPLGTVGRAKDEPSVKDENYFLLAAMIGAHKSIDFTGFERSYLEKPSQKTYQKDDLVAVYGELRSHKLSTNVPQPVAKYCERALVTERRAKRLTPIKNPAIPTEVCIAEHLEIA